MGSHQREGHTALGSGALLVGNIVSHIYYHFFLFVIVCNFCCTHTLTNTERERESTMYDEYTVLYIQYKEIDRSYHKELNYTYVLYRG